MRKMGFDGGGLGRSGSGIRQPVVAGLEASDLSAARKGIGLRPAATKPQPSVRELLFSDSSDVADEKAFGGGNARQARREWARKLRRAMGQPEQRPGKLERKPGTIAGYVPGELDSPAPGQTHPCSDADDGDAVASLRRCPKRGKRARKAGSVAGPRPGGGAGASSDDTAEAGDDAFVRAFDAKYGTAGAVLQHDDEAEEPVLQEEDEEGGRLEEEAGDAGATSGSSRGRTDWKRWDSVTRARAAERFAQVERDMAGKGGSSGSGGGPRALSTSSKAGVKGRGKSEHGFFGRRNRPSESDAMAQARGLAGEKAGESVDAAQDEENGAEGFSDDGGAHSRGAGEGPVPQARAEFFDPGLPVIDLEEEPLRDHGKRHKSGKGRPKRRAAGPDSASATAPRGAGRRVAAEQEEPEKPEVRPGRVDVSDQGVAGGGVGHGGRRMPVNDACPGLSNGGAGSGDDGRLEPEGGAGNAGVEGDAAGNAGAEEAANEVEAIGAQLLMEDEAVSREVSAASAAVAARRCPILDPGAPRLQGAAGAAARWDAGALRSEVPGKLDSGSAKSDSGGGGGAGARHQNDPLALDKLLQEPGGGWKEPKGGFVRWTQETIVQGKAAPLPESFYEERAREVEAAAVAALRRDRARAAFTLPPRAEGGAGGEVGAASSEQGALVTTAQGEGGGKENGAGGGSGWITVGANGKGITEEQEDGEFKAAFVEAKRMSAGALTAVHMHVELWHICLHRARRL